MAKPLMIARQSAHPRGLLGHVVARVMALDTARANRRVLDLIEPKPGERILELGCGHGRTLARLAQQVSPGGLAVGIDPSTVMLATARRYNRRAIRTGCVEIEPGDCPRVPYADGSFDKAFSVHTLYFWPDLASGLRELRRVLLDEGELLLAFHSSENHDVSVDIDSASGLAIGRARA